MRKIQYFPFWMFSAKQGHYWYHCYNVFGMTRSLTWLNSGPPALEASTIPLGYRGGGSACSVLLVDYIHNSHDKVLFVVYYLYNLYTTLLIETDIQISFIKKKALAESSGFRNKKSFVSARSKIDSTWSQPKCNNHNNHISYQISFIVTLY